MLNMTVTITGTAPLLMHNSRLSNPLDPAAQALKKATGKRTKTEEDHAEVARLEHFGGLYMDPDVGPYLPGDNVWRCIYDAAKKSKRGVRVKEGLLVTSDVNPIAYRGPRDAAGLWEDENFRLMASVKVGTSRIMRCRPMFRDWRCSADVLIDTAYLDESEVQEILAVAGQIIGLGDWRPRYGRFTAAGEVVK